MTKFTSVRGRRPSLTARIAVHVVVALAFVDLVVLRLQIHHVALGDLRRRDSNHVLV